MCHSFHLIYLNQCATHTIEHFGSINFDTNKEMFFLSVNFCANQKNKIKEEKSEIIANPYRHTIIDVTV